MEKNQKTFNSKLGFILAAAGSAIGMGNIWMFPYRVGQYGGAAFLIIYLAFVALFAVCGMSSEFLFGRHFQTDPVTAYQKALSKRNIKGGSAIGWVVLTASVGVAIGYAIIVGWVLRYLAGSVTGSVMTADTNAYFGALQGAFSTVPWHLIAVALTGIVILLGVNKGIEKVSKIILPAFFVIFVILAFYVSTLEGASKGYSYLFIPDWSKLADPMTWVMAMGQAFFSLSITGATLVMYGVYLKKDVNIVRIASTTAILDTVAAMISALVIIPAVFAFGIDPQAGPGLMFVTLPKIFQQMAGGQLISIFFFMSVFFAGITSLISMFEVLCGTMESRMKLRRNISTIIVCVIVFVVGLFVEHLVGPWMNFVTIYWMPFGALVGGIVVYFIMPKQDVLDEINLARNKQIGSWYMPVSKYLYVPMALIIVVLGFIVEGGIG